MPRTSINKGHIHKWNHKKVFTSKNNQHRHRIDKLAMIALSATKDFHTHQLLEQ